MAKSEVDAVTNEAVEKGGLLVKMYFDMNSENKDQLQPLLVDLINEKLLKEKGVIYCFGVIDEPMEKEKLFITNAVLTILFDGIASLTRVVFKYTPAGIEILKPLNDFKTRIPELQSMLMDLSNTSLDYSKFILEKTLKPEEFEGIKKQLENRLELTKRRIEKKD